MRLPKRWGYRRRRRCGSTSAGRWTRHLPPIAAGSPPRRALHRFRDFAGRNPLTIAALIRVPAGDCRCRLALDAQKRPCLASERRNRLSHNCTPACVVGRAVSPVNPVTPARDPGNRAATESRKPSFRPPLERSRDPQISPTRQNMKRGLRRHNVEVRIESIQETEQFGNLASIPFDLDVSALNFFLERALAKHDAKQVRLGERDSRVRISIL
jgi:hypothetical protein